MNLVHAQAQLKQLLYGIDQAPMNEQLQLASVMDSIDKSVASSPDVVVFMALQMKQLERTIDIMEGPSAVAPGLPGGAKLTETGSTVSSTQ